MKLRYVIIVALFFTITGCGRIIEKILNKESKTSSTEQPGTQKKESENKEKELTTEKENNNFERGTALKDDNENTKQEKKVKTGSKVNLRNFATMWFGSIKDGTDWEVSIVSFDGTNFKGRNTIYWKTNPSGFSTNFTGTIDDVTKKVVMYEDKKAKGSGKFTGTISTDGSKMSGSWSRYTDGFSFNWNLTKMEKGDSGH